jgi:chromosome segregation ATPase
MAAKIALGAEGSGGQYWVFGGFRESGMDGSRSEFARPTSLALMGIAAVGWLVAIYFWAEGVSLRADGEEVQRRSEVARQELVGELQAMQRAVGSAGDLRKRLDDGRKALDDAVAERTRVQTDLADLTHKVDETELSLASESDQLDSKTALLKDTTNNLKSAQEELGDLAAQKAAVEADLVKAQAALADAQAAARAADASAVAAKTAETDARAKAEAFAKAADIAQARLDAIEAQIQARRNPPTPAPSPTPSPSPTP